VQATAASPIGQQETSRRLPHPARLTLLVTKSNQGWRIITYPDGGQTGFLSGMTPVGPSPKRSRALRKRVRNDAPLNKVPGAHAQ
jgi:hypothetical protein